MALALILAGAALLAVGVAMIYPPAALIVLGTVVLALGIDASRDVLPSDIEDDS